MDDEDRIARVRSVFAGQFSLATVNMPALQISALYIFDVVGSLACNEWKPLKFFFTTREMKVMLP